jgi:5-methylcytosine-specific restriction endonuclease McrA
MASRSAYKREYYLQHRDKYLSAAKASSARRKAGTPPKPIRRPPCGHCVVCRRVEENKYCVLKARARRAVYRDKVKDTPEYKAKHCAYKRNRESRKRGIEGSFSVSEEKALYLKQGGKCAVCRVRVGVKSYHRDHIVPLSRGGSNFISNIQILCPGCNMEKGAKNPIEFMQSRGYLL